MRILAARKSVYNGRIFVTEGAGRRSLITVYGGRRVILGSMALSKMPSLVLPYTQLCSCISIACLGNRPRKILSFGLGTGSLARNFLHKYPDCEITTLEIDEEVIRVAKEYFHVEDERHEILCADGRKVSADSGGVYDLVWIDVATAVDDIRIDFLESEFRARIDYLCSRERHAVVINTRKSAEKRLVTWMRGDKKYSNSILKAYFEDSDNLIVGGRNEGGLCEEVFWSEWDKTRISNGMEYDVAECNVRVV